MMKMAFLAAAALIATPLVAQTTPGTPPPADQSTMTAPTTPPATPPASTDQTTMPAPMASPTPMASDASAAPAPAATGKLPWCRKGQFTACRERENAKGEGLSKN